MVLELMIKIENQKSNSSVMQLVIQSYNNIKQNFLTAIFQDDSMGDHLWQWMFGQQNQKAMSNDQLTKTANSKYNKSTLSKAGELSLSSAYSPNKLLQEVDNDADFQPLMNVTTAYMDRDGNIVDGSSKVRESQTQNNKNKVRQSEGSLLRAKPEIQQKYQNLASKIKSNTNNIYQSMSKKKRDKQRVFLQKNGQQLAQIQSIIGQIQEAMNSNQGTMVKSPFKMQAKLVNHKQKKNWQTKGINRFAKSDGISKLEEMLLNYNMIDQNLQNRKEEIKVPTTKTQRNKEMKERNRKYRQVEKDMHQADTKAVQTSQQVPKIQAILKNKVQQSNNQNKQNQVQLEDIEIVQFQWSRLPIIASPLYADNYELFARMRQFPENQSFIASINEVFPEQNEYKTYSIFNPTLLVGVKEDSLLSEEEYREQWASQWQYQVQEQQTKDLLCQFDFQWYRALVQLSYSHSLEQLLVKKIRYDIETYKKNVRKINGTFNDKNRVKDNLPLNRRIIYNRLKYIEIVLDKFYEEHKQKHRKGKAVVVGVIPTLAQHFQEDEVSFLKEEIPKLYVGSLYSLQKGASMAVIIPLRQAQKSNVQRISSQLVKIGNVNFLINHDQKGQKMPKIVLRREKLKNSMIKIEIMRQNEEPFCLQVGQELHFGRRYHIEMD